MTATFQGGDDKVKIVISPDESDGQALDRFCNQRFLIVQKHYFHGSGRIASLTIESMDDLAEMPKTIHHAQ